MMASIDVAGKNWYKKYTGNLYLQMNLIYNYIVFAKGF